MDSTQVVETSVTNNSPSQEFSHPYDRFPSRYITQARRMRDSRGTDEPPLEVNNGGLKAQTVDF